MQSSGQKSNLLSGNRCGVAVTLLVISSSVSGWMVYSWVEAPAGFAAAYAAAGALLFTCILGLIGLLFLFSAGTRRFGLATMLSAAWLYASFLIATAALYHLDRVPWKHERVVSLLPLNGAGLYVYFRPGTTETEIDRLVDEEVNEPRTARGQNLKAGIASFARLTPSHGQAVIAIGLRPYLTATERLRLRQRIEAQSIVAEVTDHRL